MRRDDREERDMRLRGEERKDEKGRRKRKLPLISRKLPLPSIPLRRKEGKYMEGGKS